MNFSPAESRVLDAIDDEALVRDLIDLIRVPSVTGTDAESELQHRQAAALGELGMAVDSWRIDIDAIRAHPDFPGEETDRSDGYGVVATMAGDDDGDDDGVPALVLQGHVDVVPIGDPLRWQHDPFGAWIDGDVLHGRGACDMKAGVAVNLAVARALRDSGVRLARPFAVHTVVSEEDGGLGAFATLQRGHGGEVAVITEPTSGTLITANAGALTFELRVAGRAAHGSTRLEGVSALDAFLPIHAAIARLETDRNRDPDPLFEGNPLPYPISIGRIRAGDWASSVPDLLVAEGRMGVQLGEEPRDARASFERIVADACAGDPWLRDHPVAVSWPGGQFASGRLSEDHALIDEVTDAVSALTGAAPVRAAAPYGSDLRLYTGIGGIPTLHYGPGDVRFAHAPREQVGIAETLRVARVMALLAVRRCGARLPR
ncbi:ArgE/DapE family deacylase [Microbacteriaceae bacterium VKM Ac-2854]|nr:ArgE/DapE family deacylase [Microbacteriaceae bacterium VKM Ac-2854]